MRVRMAIAGLLLAALAACAGGPQPKSEPSRAERTALHNDLIRSLLGQGQYYAALAHVEDQQRLNGDNDELRSLRADAYAALGRKAEAEALYRGLLKGRFAGEGYHGLGLLFATRDPAAALASLRAAVQAQPTRAGWRSDLGYALLNAGQLEAARTELATAVELSPDSEMYRNNLLIFLIVKKDEAAVSRLAAQWNLSTDSLGKLRRQAQTVQTRLAPKPRGARP